MSYRDETEALRAQCAALEDELRQKDEQLDELEKKLRELEDRNAKSATDVTDERAAPAYEAHVQAVSDDYDFLMLSMFVGLLLFFLGVIQLWILAIPTAVAFALLLMMALRKKKNSSELVLSEEGLWAVLGTRRSGAAWDQIEDADVVQLEDGIVKLRLCQQGRWQDLAGRWKTDRHQLSKLVAQWLEYGQARRHRASRRASSGSK